MKGQDCKLPIKEDQNFSKKEKITSKLDAFKVPLVLINAAFLLLTIILLITVFLPANRITELRQEIDNLKSAVEILQKKIDSQDDVSLCFYNCIYDSNVPV
jgi:cytoskeletal protein RodZ